MEKYEFEPVLYFSDSQSSAENLEAIPKYYSFGNYVNKNFKERKTRIRGALSLDDSVEFHMVGSIKKNPENRVYILETSVGFNSALSPNLLTVINFLDDMTENPQNILKNEKYQEDFKKAVSFLKSSGVCIGEAFKLKNEFRKRYEFNQYLFYNRAKSTLEIYEWEDKAISNYDRVSVPKKEDFVFGEHMNFTLIKLNEIGLLDFDYRKLTKLREKYRQKFFSSGEEKSIAFYKKLVNEKRKITHPLFEITSDTSFKEVLNILDEKQLLEYFPFSSDCGVEFIANAVIKYYGKN